MIEYLSAPFSPYSIHWRVGSVSRDKTKATALAYVDARDVMDRLDSVLGCQNWKDDYIAEGPRTIRKYCKSSNTYYNEQICGRVKCMLSIRIGDEWITKSDAAGETNVEGEKGGYSDAFKRAAVKFGVGRDLYRIETRWFEINQYKKFIQTPTLPDWYTRKYYDFIAKYKENKRGVSNV